MKTRLLLFILFFCFEGLSATTTGLVSNIYLRKDVGSNPIGAPVPPPTEGCVISANIINVSFDKIEDIVMVTVVNKASGKIAYMKTFYKTSFISIDLSSCIAGEYSIQIGLRDYFLEGDFTID